MVVRLARAVIGGLALLVLALMLLAAAGRVAVPPELNPFAPLDIRDTPGILTSFKVGRARSDPELCRAALDRAGLRFDPVPDQVTGEGCGFSDAGRIARLGRAVLSSPVVLSCRAALALALHERHGIGAAARDHLGSAVARIEHMGTYACRNINHAASGRRSRHATADAIDIGAFVLADGRRLTLTADWSSNDASRAAFLRAVRDAACRWFDVTLSPDYNPLHYDHFHLDVGGGRACR
ncbi:extensin-like domain-containing protein [Phreatobacter sp.]|uniref:extensin-like domain-containing protein n=1 Tax=Phreatobacter sp. TaxID=1966341 RepID=UPI003F6F6581